jgi:hypothetical protein
MPIVLCTLLTTETSSKTFCFLRLVAKTHTENYCLISYPYIVRRNLLWHLCVYTELSFLPIPSVKRQKGLKIYEFIERDYNWRCQYEIRNNHRSYVSHH